MTKSELQQRIRASMSAIQQVSNKDVGVAIQRFQFALDHIRMFEKSLVVDIISNYIKSYKDRTTTEFEIKVECYKIVLELLEQTDDF